MIGTLVGMGALCCGTVLLAAVGAAEEPVVEQWRVAEVTLTSAKTYARPFHEVDVTATFTGPGGVTLTRPAFWDGGNTWKVRFAPTKPGAWSYTTEASDPSDPGLHGRTGSLRCVPYTGNLPIYRHGFLRVADDKRHLAYRDGTPFFWLADTHWLWEKERLDEANGLGWKSQFRGMVDRRAEQGFTVYHVELFGRWKKAGIGGGAAGGEQTEPNLEHFQANIDPKWQYLADRGVVVAATLGILMKSAGEANAGPEARMARYVCARYGAYPSTWLMYQECTANRHEQFAGEEARQAYLGVVRAVARSYQRSDAYQHPRTAHSDASLVTEFRGEEWLDFTMFQGGHGKTIGRTPYYDFYFDPKHTIPQVEGEANYEHLYEGSLRHGKNLVTTDAMREKAYQAMQCGSFGYTYAANGVWQATWGGEETGNQTTYGTTPWHVGIMLPGGEQMKHMRAFYTALPWHRLLPRPECDGFLEHDARLPEHAQPAVSADAPADHVVVYFYGGEPFAGTLRHLRDTAYTARWFDPRTGEYTLIGDGVRPRKGAWRFPPKPDAGDWLLVLAAKRPAKGAVRPAPFRWPKVKAALAAEAAKNVAPRARVTASSTDLANRVYDPRHAVDRNTATDDWRHWSNDSTADPPSAEKPSWLLLEWDAPVTVKRLRLYTMEGYEVQDYSLEYRDGDAWRVFPGAEVTGNTQTMREHVLPAPVTTAAVRFLGRKGPDRQPGIVRVVEVEVITE